MSNETSRESFDKWFMSNELPDCLTARDGKFGVSVNVESICRTAWQARDAEVNELRKGVELLTISLSAEIIAMNKAVDELRSSERQVEILTTTCSEFNDENDRLRKEVERLKKVNDGVDYIIELLTRKGHDHLTLEYLAGVTGKRDAIKAAKETKE